VHNFLESKVGYFILSWFETIYVFTFDVSAVTVLCSFFIIIGYGTFYFITGYIVLISFSDWTDLNVWVGYFLVGKFGWVPIELSFFYKIEGLYRYSELVDVSFLFGGW
jgi:hypothetical protein